MKGSKGISFGIMGLPGDLALSFLPLALWALLGPALGILAVREVPSRFVAGVACSLGALASAVLLRLGLESVFPSIASNPWLLAAVTEESARYAALWAVFSLGTGYPGTGKSGLGAVKPEESAIDGETLPGSVRRRTLWFGLLAGLSFGALENLWFAVNAPAAIPIRVLLTVPVHGGAGLLIADGFVPGVKSRRGFLLAVAFHAAWDYFMSPSLAQVSVFRLFALFSLLGILFTSFILWNIVHRDGE